MLTFNNNNSHIKLRSLIISIVFFHVLAACESPLILDQVDDTRETDVRRTDTFLAASSDAENIVVVGSHGLVLVSNDDGISWKRTELDGWPALIDVTTCDNGFFAALSFEGDIWISDDSGNNWLARGIDSEETPQAITCDSGNRLWVVGAFSTIMHSDDLGQNWSSFTTDEDIILNKIQFINDNEAFVSGEFGTLMRTSDRGQSWETLPPMQNNFYSQDLYFENSMEGWAIGLVGAILHTIDGGMNWRLQQSNTLVSLFRMASTDNGLLAVGGEGKILRMEQDEWFEIDHKKDIRLYIGCIEVLQNNRILIAGPAGLLEILNVENLARKYAKISSNEDRPDEKGTG